MTLLLPVTQDVAQFMSHRSRYKLSTLASSRQDDMGMGRVTAEVIRKLARPVNTSGTNPEAFPLDALKSESDRR